MAATQSGGIPLTENIYTDSGLSSTEDAMIQNTAGNTLKLVVSETQPAADFVGAHEISPGGVWMRSDTANTAIMQGKIWLQPIHPCVIPVTK